MRKFHKMDDVMIKRTSSDKAELFKHAIKLYEAEKGNHFAYFEMMREEYAFDKELGRKHRFDFALPDFKIAVEVEGNAWNVHGGGRHMQDADLEKYNIAASLGWIVFRFSPSMLKNKPIECVDIVCSAIKDFK